MEKPAEFVPSVRVDLKWEVNISLVYPLCLGGIKRRVSLEGELFNRENSFLTS